MKFRQGLLIALALAISTPAAARCYRCSHRDRETKHEFEVATGHPYGWPGHVVDLSSASRNRCNKRP
jgi:hypothetical protein